MFDKGELKIIKGLFDELMKLSFKYRELLPREDIAWCYRRVGYVISENVDDPYEPTI